MVLITHLHGDHLFGLPGLLSSMSLLGRTAELTLIAPKASLKVCSAMIEAGGGALTFPIKVIETDGIDQQEVLFENKDCRIYAFPMRHRIATTGFVIRETEKQGNLNRSLLPADMPYQFFPMLKAGQDIQWNGETYKSENFVEKAPNPRSYAFMSDTIYLENYIPTCVSGADILYHEATFMDKETDRALKTFHSTASQAARYAKNAGVKRLLLGHFSGRYEELISLLQEARKEYLNTDIAQEGERYEV
jgi:ribonuclease Z